MRIAGLGLIVALLACAFGASSAWASKDPFNVKTWEQFKGCPYENTEVTTCVFGRTAGGSEGGEFQYGKVRVLLNKPVVIQAGIKGSGEETVAFPAANGTETLESPELTVVKGLNVITPRIEENAEWPQALIESFNAAKKAKETKAFVKIEFAGNKCFEIEGCISTQNLLEEHGSAFQLSLKVTVSSPWLEKLGGGPCEIGSDEHPIEQDLTDEGAGHFGELEFGSEFAQIEVKNSELVDTNWHIEPASGPHGCGGEFESHVDRALELALEMNNGAPSDEVGLTWLAGNLHAGSGNAVREHAEKGEV
jgi:hypothetical protein